MFGLIALIYRHDPIPSQSGVVDFVIFVAMISTVPTLPPPRRRPLSCLDRLLFSSRLLPVRILSRCINCRRESPLWNRTKARWFSETGAARPIGKGRVRMKVNKKSKHYPVSACLLPIKLQIGHDIPCPSSFRKLKFSVACVQCLSFLSHCAGFFQWPIL